MFRWKNLGLLLSPLLLAACISAPKSQPIAADAAARGIKVVRELPASLPSQLSKVADTQYLVVFSESTALSLLDNLIPLPVSVLQPIAEAYQDHEAQQLKDRYASVDPYLIARERLNDSPLLTGREDALLMMPLVYLVEANDGKFRPTLVFRVEDGSWLGRYMYHMPTTYSGEEIKGTGPEVLASLRRDLVEGSDMLRKLMERDARGELAGDERRVTYGSYYLVGSRAAGLVSASIYMFPDAEVLEEGPDHVVLRSGGKPNSGAREGALAFGVHYFRKDQLHTFKAAPEKKR